MATIPDFAKIFAQNAPTQRDWTAENYLKGWSALGQELPPRELFDALQKNTDNKLKYLFDTVSQGNNRKAETLYSVGDVAGSANLPSYCYLECTVGGTTGVIEPVWPAVGNTIADGTVTWILRDKRQVSTYTNATDLANLAKTKVPDLGFILGLLANLSQTQDVIIDGDSFSCPALGFSGLLAQNGYIKFGRLFHDFCLQWRSYQANVQANGYYKEALPLTFSEVFAALLSDTNAENGGVSGDLSGGSSIKIIKNNSVEWLYDWNTSANILVSVFVIGKA